ncbi:beta-ketoacyl-ACP synthase III, partial [Bdellovibrionota bacterium FG-2]
KQRHWVDQDSATCTSDLALEAAKKAIENAGIQKEELDMILLATLSPDHVFPGTACFFQAKLGTPGIPAMDIRQQCSGFLYGLSVADQFIKTGAARTVLVVGAETHSRALEKNTNGRDIAVLFGDGAGAVVVRAAEGPKDKNTSHILSTHLHSDGRFAKELWLEEPSMARPGDWMQVKKMTGEQYPKMNGKLVFVNAVRRMTEVLNEAFETNKISISDIDLFIVHQANLRINEALAKAMGIPEDKIFNTIDRFGNTTAATIPIGFDEALKAGKLKKGMLVASGAFGSGFTWSSAIIRW